MRLALLVGSVVLLGLWAGLSALVVVLAIVVMIFLHELGHFVTARAAGMKCTEFFIGFGPRIWSFTRGETEYGIKAIPAGAYVKVIGMTNLEEVDPADESRTYREKPYWRRMSVAVAGSTMHFMIALLAMLVYFAAVGAAEDDNWEVGYLAGPEPSSVSPAEQAGLDVGDRIVAIDGAPVVTFDDLQDVLGEHRPGESVGVTVNRDGQAIERTVDLGESGEGGAFLGIGAYYPPQRLSLPSAAVRTVTEFAEVSRLTVEAIGRIFSPSGISSFLGMAVDTARTDAPDTTASDETDIEAQGDRVLSIYGAARLGTQMADTGPAGLLLFLALINIFIGIFNLVPLLPLDGGHVAIATYERVREVLSRSKARYHADVAKLIPLTYAVIFVLVGIGLVALYLDIASPLELPN
ncbi:MAG: site-2 protease family protein [Acidimicrobiales bacterium]|nr:site-2 protease family protein [Acidimicrobiales bacterium]